jgi:hypothetical protein
MIRVNWKDFIFLYCDRVPTPVAIVVSACAFAAAHLTPGEFPQLAALGKRTFLIFLIFLSKMWFNLWMFKV